MPSETRSFSSSVLSSGTYDTETKMLTLIFNSGRSYDYPGTSLETWEGLKNASSKGRYFNAYIK
jgi:hypothetical protein